MIVIRRKTREAHRHDRATVLQQLGAQADADPRAFWEANKARAAMLRRGVEGGDFDGGQPRLGLVTGKPLAGGKGTTSEAPSCDKCNDQAGGCWYCGRG